METAPGISLRIDPNDFKKKLGHIKAWLFDWDGIFNEGHKGVSGNNTFSERDSMGTNMLRFAHHLRTGEQAYCAIITGASNDTSPSFGQREHFHAVVPGALYKRDVVEILLRKWGVAPHETAFFFDDILDLNVCEYVGLRIQIAYSSTPILNRFVEQNDLADLVCHHSGQQQAVRRLSEYFIDIMGQSDEVIRGRMSVNDVYMSYFNERQKIQTQIFTRDQLLAKEE